MNGQASRRFRALTAAGLALAFVPPLRAEVTRIVGSAKAMVVQFDGSNPLQTDFNQVSVPDTRTEPPALARARLDRHSDTGQLTASAEAACVFVPPNVTNFGPPNDVGLDLGAFSADATTQWYVEGAASEHRTVIFNQRDTGGQAFFGFPYRAHSRLMITGALVIAAEKPDADLSGVRVNFSFSLMLRAPSGSTTTPLSGSVSFVGGPNGATQTKDVSGNLAGVFLPVFSFVNEVSDIRNIRALVFPAVNLPYEYQVRIGQEYELELQVRAELYTKGEGVAAAAVFGLPQDALPAVMGRVKLDDSGAEIADLIAGEVDTTGQSYVGGSAEVPLRLSQALPLCGVLGMEAAGLLIGGCWLAQRGRSRGRPSGPGGAGDHVSGAGATEAVQAIVWCAVLLGAVVFLATVIVMIRRRIMASRADESRVPWTLQNLRQMRAQGTITEEEFEKLKSRLLDSPEVRMLRGGKEAKPAGGKSDVDEP